MEIYKTDNKNELCGFINIHKEAGYTSHDVVAITRRVLRKLGLSKVKVGHTGTLDPDATGVLAICVGKATRLADYAGGGLKKYQAVLKLGITTTTQDTSGEIISTSEKIPTREEILSILPKFIGEIDQLPPMYSAVKVNGQKLYDAARKGQEVERKPRKVTVYDIKVPNFIDDKTIELEITCGRGTYVRTICNDIGDLLGCGGTMDTLVRTMTGNFKIEDGVKLSELEEYASVNNTISKYLIEVANSMDLPSITIKDDFVAPALNGNRIYLENVIGGVPSDITVGSNVFLYTESSVLLGMHQWDEVLGATFLKPVVMIATHANIKG